MFNYQVFILASGGNEEHHLVWEMFVYSGIVLAIIGIFIYLAKKGLKEKVPRYLPTQIAEHLYHYIDTLLKRKSTMSFSKTFDFDT